MSNSVINFFDAKIARNEKANLKFSEQSKKQTLNFACNINNLVEDCKIDPVHQATLLMAKAIDILASAGPVPLNLEEQHNRALNLLHSVINARGNLMEKSVRILYSGEVGKKIPFGELKV